MSNLKQKIESKLKGIKFKLRNYSPQVLYSKKWIVPKILNANPIPITGESDFEIHVLVSKRDFLAMLWCLYSLYIYGYNEIGLVVHDDGSLETYHREKIESVFPGAKVISRSESNDLMEKKLANFPNCKKFRNGHATNLKVLDFCLLSRKSQIIFFDSDIIFYEAPTAIINNKPENIFLEDIWTNYCISIEELESIFNVKVPPKINIGFGKVNREFLDLNFIEKALDIPQIRDASYIADQTLIALLTARNGVKTIGHSYKMTLEKGIANKVIKHYTNIIRYLLYTEGIPYISKKLCL